MLLIECAHLQDSRSPGLETVKGWIFNYTVTNQNEVTRSLTASEVTFYHRSHTKSNKGLEGLQNSTVASDLACYQKLGNV